MEFTVQDPAPVQVVYLGSANNKKYQLFNEEIQKNMQNELQTYLSSKDESLKLTLNFEVNEENTNIIDSCIDCTQLSLNISLLNDTIEHPLFTKASNILIWSCSNLSIDECKIFIDNYLKFLPKRKCEICNIEDESSYYCCPKCANPICILCSYKNVILNKGNFICSNCNFNGCIVSHDELTINTNLKVFEGLKSILISNNKNNTKILTTNDETINALSHDVDLQFKAIIKKIFKDLNMDINAYLQEDVDKYNKTMKNMMEYYGTNDVVFEKNNNPKPKPLFKLFRREKKYV